MTVIEAGLPERIKDMPAHLANLPPDTGVDGGEYGHGADAERSQQLLDARLDAPKE